MNNADQFDLFLRIAAALGMGALIGLQREFRGHQAGIRTSSLVCAGATVFGVISLTFSDDSRIAAAVVQGIGFLGAGLIFQRGSDVHGVTTAATIWILAGIGLLVSLEWWLVASLLTLSVVVLLELSPISDWVYRSGQQRRGRKKEQKAATAPLPGEPRA